MSGKHQGLYVKMLNAQSYRNYVQTLAGKVDNFEGGNNKLKQSEVVFQCSLNKVQQSMSLVYTITIQLSE